MKIPPQSVLNFRAQYQKESIPSYYNGIAHLAFTLSIWGSALIYCIYSIKNPTSQEWLVIPCTFLFSNFVEYFFHRYPMHRKMPLMFEIFKRHTLEHHHYFTHDLMEFENTRDFKMVLFPLFLILIFFGILIVGTGLFVGVLFSQNAGYFYSATGIFYFLNYEILHLAYHTPKTKFLSRIPYLESLKKLHQNHHCLKYMSHKNFNITYPIFDWIMGTKNMTNSTFSPHEIK